MSNKFFKELRVCCAAKPTGQFSVHCTGVGSGHSLNAPGSINMGE